MALRSGRCTNVQFCARASARECVEVSAHGRFGCPLCGKALTPWVEVAPAAPGVLGAGLLASAPFAMPMQDMAARARPAAGGFALGLLAGGLLFGGGTSGSAPVAVRMKAAVRAPVAAVSPAQRPKPAAPAAVPAPAPKLAAAPGALPQDTMGLPATSHVVTLEPVRAVALAGFEAGDGLAAGRHAARPERLTGFAWSGNEARLRYVHEAVARVAIRPALPEAARDTRMPGDSLVETPKPQASVPPQDKVAAPPNARPGAVAAKTPGMTAAETAAASRPALPAPVQAAAPEALKPARHYTDGAQFADTAPPGAGPHLLGDEPAAHIEIAGFDQPFSDRPVAGGAPDYPLAARLAGRAGSVTVSCHILTDGRPQACSILAAESEGAAGGQDFKHAVQNWLNSGRVRFAPILRNGRAVSEEHQWRVRFPEGES